MATVNLDAMIQREDFEVGGELLSSGRIGQAMKLAELLPESIGYQTLRKPDFQRETSSWPPERVAAFIASFLDGDLIPAVIMWRSPATGINFVVDGAHRLSALIAWVNDDYGAGIYSKLLFREQIEPLQMKVANKTRAMVGEKIGRYSDLVRYPANPEGAPDPKTLLRARNIASMTLFLQWVDGDAAAAEKSFFRINQSAAKIDETELELIESRRKPNAIATRALIRAGTGHQYWSHFGQPAQQEIKALAAEVYEELFRPIVDYPIKTLDLPVAGSGYTADSVRMVLDLTNILNRAEGADQQNGGIIEDDPDGSDTIAYLKRVRRIAARCFGPSSGSLALHPGVYCYGNNAKFHPASFMTAVLFIRELMLQDKLLRFTKVRSKFEEFILVHKHFANQIGSNKGSRMKGLPSMLLLYRSVFDGVGRLETHAEIVEFLKTVPSLGFLQEQTEDDRKYGRNFTRETKDSILFKKKLAAEIRCAHCDARLHFRGISFDHENRKEDGGRGNPENGQLMHPFCNTGAKESDHHQKVANAK